MCFLTANPGRKQGEDIVSHKAKLSTVTISLLFCLSMAKLNVLCVIFAVVVYALASTSDQNRIPNGPNVGVCEFFVFEF